MLGVCVAASGQDGSHTCAACLIGAARAEHDVCARWWSAGAACPVYVRVCVCVCVCVSVHFARVDYSLGDGATHTYNDRK